MEHLTPFNTWLTEQGYQNSTAMLTLRHIDSAFNLWVQNGREALPNGYHTTPMRRYLAYTKETGQHSFPKTFAAAIGREYRPVKPAANGPRAKPHLTEGQWEQLFQKAKSSRVFDDTVLVLYMQQPARLSEFLEMSPSDLEEEIGKNRALAGFNSRFKSFAVQMCPGSEKAVTCARTRLRRRLAYWAAELGYEVDLNSLNRTSARLYYR